MAVPHPVHTARGSKSDSVALKRLQFQPPPLPTTHQRDPLGLDGGSSTAQVTRGWGLIYGSIPLACPQYLFK